MPTESTATGAFEPYAPLNVPKPFADDVFIVDGPEIRMDYFGFKLPFGTRMTVIRLPDGGLWLHSPIAPEPGLVDAVNALGPVRVLVAPNTLHYWWLADWAARFPDAAVFAPQELEKTAKRPLPPFTPLGAEAPAAWRGVIDQTGVQGPLLSETAFFHRPSRTLILTDLIENFEPDRIRSPLYRWIMQVSGAADPDGKAPIDMQLSFLGRRKAVRQMVETMLAWRPLRIVIAHGRCYQADGERELRRAFRWVL